MSETVRLLMRHSLERADLVMEARQAPIEQHGIIALRAMFQAIQHDDERNEKARSNQS